MPESYAEVIPPRLEGLIGPLFPGLRKKFVVKMIAGTSVPEQGSILEYAFWESPNHKQCGPDFSPGEFSLKQPLPLMLPTPE